MNENFYLYNSVKEKISFIDESLKRLINLILRIWIPDKKIVRYFVDRLWKFKILFFFPFFCICTFCSSVMVTSDTDNTFVPLILPEEIEGMHYDVFNIGGYPNNTPFGTLVDTYITANYHDTEYLLAYGKEHNGVDIIPTQNYYANNEAYKLTKEPVFFATCTGIATSHIDSFNANYINILCNDKKHKVQFVHNKTNFVLFEKKTQVIAGQPIGIMGSTGKSSGPHIHYAIIDIETGKYIDPMQFAQSKADSN